MIHIDPAGALGLHLAQRLVICGVHLDCLEGSEWTTGFDQLDRLQVLLQGFMHRRGVAAWPGAYGDVRGFNKVKAGVHERPGCC